MSIERSAVLKLKYIQIWMQENKMSVQFNVMDIKHNCKLQDVFVNFIPSETLLSLLESEIDTAINTQYEKEKDIKTA